MSLFQLTSHHTHGTRNSKHNSLTLPMATSNKTKSLITFSGPQNWNKYCLNMTETNSKTIKTFTKTLKASLISEKSLEPF